MKTKAKTTRNLSQHPRCATLLLAFFTFVMLQPAVHATEQVPFKGFAAGVITGMTPGPDGVTFTVHAVGNATQLGRFTREETLLLDPATLKFTGTIVFTAANGDQLRVAVAGGFTSPTTVEGTYTFQGGTGRFANAAGAAVFAATTEGGLVAVEFSGEISSVGAKATSP